jgi:hypothetical protein
MACLILPYDILSLQINLSWLAGGAPSGDVWQGRASVSFVFSWMTRRSISVAWSVTMTRVGCTMNAKEGRMWTAIHCDRHAMIAAHSVTAAGPRVQGRVAPEP